MGDLKVMIIEERVGSSHRKHLSLPNVQEISSFYSITTNLYNIILRLDNTLSEP